LAAGFCFARRARMTRLMMVGRKAMSSFFMAVVPFVVMDTKHTCY
jgi:hypothetical protein